MRAGWFFINKLRFMSKRKDDHAHFFQGVVGQLLTSWEFWYGASQKNGAGVKNC